MAHHNADLINGLYKQLKPVMDASKQGMYIYFDDEHKVCNKRFATLLGYSPESWASVKESFPVAFVDEDSQHDLVSAYQEAMEHRVGSAIDVTWKTKSDERVTTQVLLVPFAFENHLFAVHFVTEQ